MPIRLDKLLADRALLPSRERAQAMVLAGRVLVNEQKITKPGAQVAENAVIRLLGEDLRYVSRGGLKLEKALSHWNIDLPGRSTVDIGASTGGFTDCMLQHGASHVLAVDTGYGQIAHKLRADERVRLMERTNARLLESGTLAREAAAPPTFFSMDVSFIGASLVLPAVLLALAAPGTSWRGEAVILVKPQFEAGREHVGKGGIVRDPAAHAIAIERVKQTIAPLGASNIEVIESPITGTEGNREFLLHATFM
ncbi:MAG: TlyA family RNA methyltransferase [Acidobacteria bacterium]|nr:TlyA family RNA methyltransferase [Acidobacteriota bacterium]